MQTSDKQTSADASKGDDLLLVPVFRRLHDANSYFVSLARLSRHAQHQQFANRQYIARQEFVRELRSELQDARNEPVDGSLSGIWHLVWHWIRSLLTHDELELLNNADRVDTALLYAYLQALEARPKSRLVREKLQRQQGIVQQSQRETRALRSLAVILPPPPRASLR